MITKRSKGYSAKALEQALFPEGISFGEAVESLRLRDDISLTALAKKIGVSRQYLCDVEKGRRFVSPEQAARFAKAFGHPAEVLVQLSLQDSVRASGLALKVSVRAA
jgi:transcriptional regulator with XRE-family HTH domain